MWNYVTQYGKIITGETLLIAFSCTCRKASVQTAERSGRRIIMDVLLPPKVSAVYQCRDKWEHGKEQKNEWKINFFSDDATEEAKCGWFHFLDGDDLNGLEFKTPHLTVMILPEPHPREPGPQAPPGRGSMTSHAQEAKVIFPNPLSQLHPILPCFSVFQRSLHPFFHLLLKLCGLEMRCTTSTTS